MPKKPSATLLVLREIRDELKQTNERLGAVERRQTETNERLDAVERRQTETETRLATELVAVAKAVGEVRDLLRDRLDVRDRVDEHERRIAVLEHRLEHEH